MPASAYLLDTSVVVRALSANHPDHAAVQGFLAAHASDPITISVVTIGELTFGIEAAERVSGKALAHLAHKKAYMSSQIPMEITKHTSDVYGKLRAAIAVKYLPNVTRKARPTFIQDWIDPIDEKALGINENDVWISAQALEHDYDLVVADKHFDKIKQAEPALRLVEL